MQAPFSRRVHNPDVLSCIANLSNDEVFTPPELVDQMLNVLEDSWSKSNDGELIWSNPSIKFLDPCTKSGVFLREITKRLVEGQHGYEADIASTVDRILRTQVFGIGITNLTSLLARRSVYCSKFADGEYSIFKSSLTSDGNIWFDRVEHTWKNSRCKFCGASQLAYERDEELESYAYEFIHASDIGMRMNELFGGSVNFDVVIGNPPYQLGSDGGTRDVPIYQHFVDQAKKLNPRFISMVVPSRWMAGGLGLTEFRTQMLNDRRLEWISDFHDSTDAFPGVDIAGGVCYFVWNSSHDADCTVETIHSGVRREPSKRDLTQHDVLVRDDRAVGILEKVLSYGEDSITELLSADKEFGWTSNFRGFHLAQSDGDVPIYFTDKGKRSRGWIERSEIVKSPELIDTWKVMISSAYGERGSYPYRILAHSFVAPSPSVCTQTYLFFSLASESEAESLRSYLYTRFVRFLISLRKITQHATRATYTWVPQQSWNRKWSDQELYAKYGISDDEAEYIESMIRAMELDDGD